MRWLAAIEPCWPYLPAHFFSVSLRNGFFSVGCNIPRDGWTEYTRWPPFCCEIKLFFNFLILGYTKTAINNNTQIWAPPKNNFIQWCHNMEYEKRNPSVELWHLNSALWALTLDPPSFVRGWEPEKKRLWGKIRNLLPQLALISPCWAYFIPTHKQSLVHRRWRFKTQMKDACWTTGCCWDQGSLSDNEPHLSVSFCLGKFAWNSPWIGVVLLDLMLFWK